MASRYRPRNATTPPQGRRAAARQRERRVQRWVVALFAAVLALIVAIPAFGYFNTFVLPPRQVVVQVNEAKHTLGEVVKRARATVNVIAQQGSDPEMAVLPFEIVNNMVDEELLRQNASSVGVIVTQEDVDAEIRRLHFPTPPEGQQVDQASLEKEYQEVLRRYLNLTTFSESEYQAIIRSTLLSNQVREKLSSQVPSVAEQVYVHWIKITDQNLIDTIQNSLKSDASSFVSLARIYMRTDAYADQNGEVGWMPKGAFPSLDTVLFPDEGKTVELNKISEPVLAGDGTYFLKVTQGPETREVSDKMRDVLKTRGLQQWLNEQRDANNVQVSFNSDDYQWVVNKVRELSASPQQGTS
ncbi:MAG: SurA N-terminal domain-containing protein [Chloroflexi bacterium]|nr:SurA N-terminal domain-containing protein [Chloroflexota bacterium]